MQNPYAPPKDFGILPGSLPAPAGSPRGFRAGEVLEAAWPLFKRHWPVLVAAIMVWTVPGGMLSSVPATLLLLKVVEPNSVEYWTTYGVTSLASQVISYFFQVGFVRISLGVARGQTPEFITLFSGFDRFLPLLLMSWLYYLLASLGMLLLIVPGIIVFVGFGLATFYCVDAGLGPIASLRRSWNAMRGHKWAMFVFLCLAFLISMIGMLACCVGMLPAFGLLYVAWAIIYVRLSGYERSPVETHGA